MDLDNLISKISDEELREQISAQVTELSGSTLRKKVEELSQENSSLKQESRHRAYKDAKLPPGSYDVFDSMYDGELTVEGLHEFATSKGFQILEGETQQGAEGTQQYGNLAEADGKLNGLNAGNVPPREPTLADRISEAEANKDWHTASLLKAEQLEKARVS